MHPGWAFYRCHKGQNHPWVILSNPDSDGRVLCVNITTLREESVDDECILEPADYAWLTHRSVVAFSRARFWTLEQIGEAVQAGLLKRPHPDHIPPATLAKIVSIAKLESTRQLDPPLKRML